MGGPYPLRVVDDIFRRAPAVSPLRWNRNRWTWPTKLPHCVDILHVSRKYPFIAQSQPRCYLFTVLLPGSHQAFQLRPRLVAGALHLEDGVL